MKRYCTSCGSPTEFSLKKPNYCSNCGVSFEKGNKLDQIMLNKSSQISQKVKRPTNIEIENEDDNLDLDIDSDSDVTSVPDIKNIEVETAVPRQRGEKIKDMMRSPIQASKRNPNLKIKNQKNSNKKILEDFQREAGSLRSKNNK